MMMCNVKKVFRAAAVVSKARKATTAAAVVEDYVVEVVHGLLGTFNTKYYRSFYWY